MYLTLTGTPFCLPGFHLGIPFKTRSASLSKYLSTLRIIRKSVVLPSLFTIEEIINTITNDISFQNELQQNALSYWKNSACPQKVIEHLISYSNRKL